MKKDHYKHLLFFVMFMGWALTTFTQIPPITSFSPIGAKPGDEVTLTGTNFNTATTENAVFFGATRARVTAATTTSVTVTVPTRDTYAPITPITLLNSGTSLVAYSLGNFTPTYSPAKTTAYFKAKQDFDVVANPYYVAIGDLDGDGKPDLAVANSNSNTISIYRNTSTSCSIGTGSFATNVDSSTGNNPLSIAIGDLDGDCKPNLAVANAYSNSVSIYRNTSISGIIDNNSFANRIEFSTTDNPYSVAIGDLDVDGKPVLGVANVSSSTISIYRNTSASCNIDSSSFTSKVDFNMSSGPQSVAIGDLDGDGKPDLAVTNQGLTTVHRQQ